MKKIFMAVCSLAFLFGNTGLAQTKEKKATTENSKKVNVKKNLYDLKAEDINGKTFDFASLKGKKVMIVNTASQCGLTPQYEALEQLYEKYKATGFTIVGFPANDFGHQEPGTNEEISGFCKKNYGVTFPMMAKITVKNPGMHEVYQFLTQKSQNGLQDNEVQWNFQKYLINEKGELVKVISPRTLPTDPEIVNWITNNKQ